MDDDREAAAAAINGDIADTADHHHNHHDHHHYSNYDHEASPPPPRKRRRPAVACVRCRRRKIKCDREQPCSQCRRSKDHPPCVYDADGDHTYHHQQAQLHHFDSSHLAPPGAHNNTTNNVNGSNQNHLSSHSRSHELLGPPSVYNEGSTTSWTPSSIDTPGSHRNLVDYRSSDALSGRLTSHSSPATQHLANAAEDDDALVKRVDRLEGLLRHDGSPSMSMHSPASVVARDAEHSKRNAKDVATSGVREFVNKTRFFGKSHHANTFGQFNKAAQIDARQIVDDPELVSTIEQCKSIARDIKSSRFGSTHLLSPDLASLVPTRETADRLVQLYFRAFESAYRVFHIPCFYREYAQFWNNAFGGVIAQPFVIKLFLVMSLGACFDSEESSRILAPQWIAISSHWLNVPSEKGHLNVSTVQIYCLLILAKQFNNVAGDLAWIPAGGLIRTAMSIGLYRDPKHFPQLTPYQAEMRRRLWATILELDIQASLDAGMPPLISVDDFDCEPPSNIDDDDIDEDTTVAPTPKPDNVFTQTTTQLALLASVRTRLAIAKVVNDFRQDPSDEKVMSLTEDLTAHLRTQGRQFDSYSRQHASNLSGWTPSRFQQNLLDLLTRRFLLSLLLPYSVKENPDPRHFYFRKLSVDCALTFVSYLSDTLFGAIPSSVSASTVSSSTEDNNLRVRVPGGGALRDIVVHSGIIIAMELIHNFSEDFNPAGISNAARQPLRKAFDDVIDMSCRKFHIGETNAKVYIYFSIVRERIDALGTDRDYASSMRIVARQKAKDALDILRDRNATLKVAEQRSAHDRFLPPSAAATPASTSMPLVRNGSMAPQTQQFGSTMMDASSLDQGWLAQMGSANSNGWMDTWPLFSWDDGSLL